MEKRLVRKRDDRMVAGVASGIADYLSIDPAIVRLIFVIMTLAGGPGIILYFIMMLIMPDEGAVSPAKGHAFDEEEIIVDDES